MQAVIERTRMRDKEAYNAFVFERRLTDEITNATERIAMPMRNTFEYTFDDGDLWYQGQNIREILLRTIEINERVVEQNPQFITELIRNHIEFDEYQAELVLAAGEEGSPDTLVVMTPIPDAVVAGVDLGAYDKERMKMLVRIHTRTPAGVEATSLSLDRSDRAGMEAIASQFGAEVPEEATSEDILAMRMWGWRDDFEEDIADVIRKTYDDELTRQHGGRWHAGRQDKEIRDARTFVESQSDLLQEHMEIINFIHEFAEPATKKAELKAARYNFAAALSRRHRGDMDAASLGDAGDQARANNEKYDGDCPDGDEVSATQSLNAMGLAKTGEITMTCPHCGFKTVGDPCAAVLTCNECAATVANGKLIDKGIGRRGVLSRRAAELVSNSRPEARKTPTKQDIIKARYGEHAGIKDVVGVMTAYTVIYDRRTGLEIEKL